LSKRKRRNRGQRRPPPPRPSQARRAVSAKRAADRGRAAGRDERPPAPWGSFPLVELSALIGLILLVLGFLVVKGTQGGVMIGVGVVLGAMAGLELSIREHFAGFRSHTLLLAGFAAAIVLAALFYLAPAELPVAVRLVAGGLVFAGAARALSLLFERRAGVAYKLR
jgi:hypothetical protein